MWAYFAADYAREEAFMSQHSDEYLYTRALQAIDALKSIGHPDAARYDQWAKNKIIEKASGIIDETKETLNNQATKVLDELRDFGLTNKRIAKDAGYDEVFISRTIHRNGNPSIQQLLCLVTDLQDYRNCRAKIEQFKKSVNNNPLKMLDACSPATQTDEIRFIIKEIAFENLIFVLTDNLDKIKAYPQGFPGAILQLGTEEVGMTLIVSEGTSEIEKLEHYLHELNHHRDRVKDEISMLKKKAKSIKAEDEGKQKKFNQINPPIRRDEKRLRPRSRFS
jgi:hypothetical protein